MAGTLETNAISVGGEGSVLAETMRHNDDGNQRACAQRHARGREADESIVPVGFA